MLNILKSGGRLSLAEGGRLPRSSKCCCENEAGCHCTFICAYGLQATTTSGLAVISDPAPCDTVQGPQTVEAGFQFSPPHVDAYWFDDYSTAAVSATSSSLYGGVFHYARGPAGISGAIPPRNVLCTIGASINIEFICSTVLTDEGYVYQNRAFITTFVQVYTEASQNLLMGSDNQLYRMRKTGVFVLPASCIRAPQQVCPGFEDWTVRLIDTPLAISINGETTSLGDYTSVEESVSGVTTYGDRAKDIGEYIRDSIDATFDLFVRPSCEQTECSCGYSLDGIAMSLKGERFVVGNEPNPVRTSRAQQVWTFTDGANPSITYEVWDEFFLFIQQRIVAELFCSSEEQDSNLPNPQEVPTWYMFATADCFEWEAGIVVATTRETIIGRYDCYEHCEKFLPHGSPRPVVSVSVETPEGYGGGCAPPQNAIVIIDFEACE